MLRRFLAFAAVTAGLVLSPIIEHQVPVQAEECFLTEVCWVTPTESDCDTIVVCVGGG